jgi:muramidase (phage lysozyme)
MADEMKAFLWMIRWCEGTANPDGYRTLFGGRLFDSFADHPRQLIRFKLKGVTYKSSAAGAYQFLRSTWDSLVKMYGYKDFSPENQDAAAIQLIKGRRAYQDVLNGDIVTAIKKCNREWASLPGSPYGQPVKTMSECLRVYGEKLKELQNGKASPSI